MFSFIDIYSERLRKEQNQVFMKNIDNHTDIYVKCRSYNNSISDTQKDNITQELCINREDKPFIDYDTKQGYIKK